MELDIPLRVYRNMLLLGEGPESPRLLLLLQTQTDQS